MTPNRVYFLGIGGIGMSALARYFRRLGSEVYGYDRTATPLTRELEAEGMHVHYTDDPTQIPDGLDLVVYTPAVPTSTAEFQHLAALNVPMKKRAEVLGDLSRSKRALAVAGTHGKTTTTCLLTHLLRTGGVDCSAFLGGIARNFRGNFVYGAGAYVVVEADEYDRSFLHLQPYAAAITSIDPDHLDIYGDAETMFATGFGQFAQQVTGNLYIPHGLAQNFDNQRITTFGLDGGESFATNIRTENGSFVFDYVSGSLRLNGLTSTLPGRHNVFNAVGAIRMALDVGVAPDAIRAGLDTFAGIHRRFERLYDGPHGTYIDDYAHHPTELRAAIGAARELFPDRHMTVVFQPHLYSRTYDFADGFAQELDQADAVVLLPIYPAREEPMPGVTSGIIYERMKLEERYLVEKSAVVEFLEGRKVEVLLTLGAGDIDTLRDPFWELFLGLESLRVG